MQTIQITGAGINLTARLSDDALAEVLALVSASNAPEIVSTEETWRPVPEREEILASSHGRVHRVRRAETRGAKSKPTFGTLSRQPTANGEYVKRVVQWRGYGLLLVSRLVCAAFHGPAPFEGAVVMHLDDDPLNNRPENLRWATQRQNLNSASTKPMLDEHRRAAARARWEHTESWANRE